MRIEAQGDVLVVTVQERPTISSSTFVGNKEFDTDTVKKALKEVGIAERRASSTARRWSAPSRN